MINQSNSTWNITTWKIRQIIDKEYQLNEMKNMPRVYESRERERFIDLNEDDLILCSRAEEYMQEIKGARLIRNESAKL